LSKTDKTDRNTSTASKESGERTGMADDVVSTQQVAGMKSPHFGLAIDSIGRSTPTHMIPFHIRKALSEFWKGGLAFYDDLTPVVSTGLTADSVAHRLSTTVKEAESFGSGSPSSLTTTGKLNFFKETSDVPLSPAQLSRLSFWRFHPDAAELDPAFGFEAQVAAVDAASQLFVECFDWHFHFLATLDSEYHRLRAEGPQGTLADDSNKKEAWYNMYHYWRQEMKQRYLVPKTVILPTGLENSSWTIGDVLQEILREMVDADGNFRQDIFISEKGAARAKSGASLGIINDPAYYDNDGNIRFYMQSIKGENPYVNAFNHDVTSGSDVETHGGNGYYSGSSTTRALGTTDVTGATNAVPDPGQPTMLTGLDWAAANGQAPQWFIDARAAGASGKAFTLSHCFTQSHFQDIMSSGRLDSGYYWRGYALSLPDMTAAMRKLGRALEPEVAQGFLPQFGLLQSPVQLSLEPQGLSSREYDDLYNLYESNYMYKDNPIRTYSGGHLGPLDVILEADDLVIEGVDYKTAPETLREKFWTPSEINTPLEAGKILNYFLPGTTLNGLLCGDIAMSGNGANKLNLSDLVDFELMSRIMGDAPSMLSKVERPVIVPAGLSDPESAFASGVGPGALQLLLELLRSGLGGAVQFALGHNGFTDWQVSKYFDDVIDPSGDSSWNGIVPASRAELTSAESPYFWVDGHNSEIHTIASGMARAIGRSNKDFSVLEDFDQWMTDDQYLKSNKDIRERYEALFPAVMKDLGPPPATAYSSDGNTVLGHTNLITSPLDLASQWGLPAFNGPVSTPGSAQLSGWITAGTTSKPNVDILVMPKKVWIEDKSGTMHSIDTGFVDANDVLTATGLEALTWFPSYISSPTTVNGYPDKPETIPVVVMDSTGRSEVNETYGAQGTAGSVALWNISTTPAAMISTAISELLRTQATAALLNDMTEISAWIDIICYVKTSGNSHATTPTALTVADRACLQSLGYKVEWDKRRRTNLPFECNLGVSSTAGDLSLNGTSTAQSMGQVRIAQDLSITGGVSQLNATNSAQNVFDATAFVGFIVPKDDTNATIWSLVAETEMGPGVELNTLQWKISTKVDEDFLSNQSAGGLAISPHMATWATSNGGVSSPTWETFSPIYATIGTTGNVAYSFGLHGWAGHSLTHSLTFYSTHVGIGSSPWAIIPYSTSGITPTNPTGARFGRAYISANQASMAYVIPDEPANRMVYRPYRRLVDAAISREEKQLFMPTHENLSPGGGPLGLPFYGDRVPFRMAQLAFDAKKPQQFVLEKALMKTRMVDTSNRGMLTFTKVALLDTDTQTHLLPQAVKVMSDAQYTRGAGHAASAAGGAVYTRENIREVQLGRQFQKLG